MNNSEIERLAVLCHQWRILLKSKETRYLQIRNPLDRIEPALELVDIGIELRLFEEDFCQSITLPQDVFQPL